MPQIDAGKIIEQFSAQQRELLEKVIEMSADLRAVKQTIEGFSELQQDVTRLKQTVDNSQEWERETERWKRDTAQQIIHDGPRRIEKLEDCRFTSDDRRQFSQNTTDIAALKTALNVRKGAETTVWELARNAAAIIGFVATFGLGLYVAFHH